MFQPLYDKLLVEPLVNECIDMYGTLVPISKDPKLPRFGIVKAVGNGLITPAGIVPLQAKVGDKVMYPNFGGVTVYDSGKELVLIKEVDVLGIVKE